MKHILLAVMLLLILGGCREKEQSDIVVKNEVLRATFHLPSEHLKVGEHGWIYYEPNSTGTPSVPFIALFKLTAKEEEEHRRVIRVEDDEEVGWKLLREDNNGTRYYMSSFVHTDERLRKAGLTEEQIKEFHELESQVDEILANIEWWD